MKNLVIAGAIAAAVAAAVVPTAVAAQAAVARPAATAEELRLLREQIQALSERLQKLEQANAELAASNSQLQQQAAKVEAVETRVEELQVEQDATLDQLAKTRANAPEWAGRFALRGDIRYRHEWIDSGADRAVAGTPAATFPVVNSLDRSRDRVRFRFGGTLRVNDSVTVGMQLATGGEDPRSSNQTLTDQSSRKSIGLDQAFVAWAPTANWLVRLGKMPQPWVRPGSSLFFDSDVNPEGVAVNYTRGYFFGGASYVLLQERGPTQVVAGQGQVDVSDPAMGHLQAGLRYPFTATSSVTLGASYYDHFAVQGRRPFFGGNASGNTTVSVAFPAGSATTVAVAALDYDVVQMFAQYDRVVFETLPFMFYVDYAKNGDASLDTAWSTGFTLGRASDPGKWELGALYQKIEKDALFGQWIDSDFGNGSTDVQGWLLRAGWAPRRNVTLNATYYLNDLNVDVFSPAAPRERRYERLQLDANFRF
ncbi:MAG: putative porin [Steroidobacteraceae bacterium]|jgi:hypothetical protein|nr:putative porin [Steroidobacteraceae bacterium]